MYQTIRTQIYNASPPPRKPYFFFLVSILLLVYRLVRLTVLAVYPLSRRPLLYVPRFLIDLLRRKHENDKRIARCHQSEDQPDQMTAQNLIPHSDGEDTSKQRGCHSSHARGNGQRYPVQRPQHPWIRCDGVESQLHRSEDHACARRDEVRDGEENPKSRGVVVAKQFDLNGSESVENWHGEGAEP